MIYPQKRVVSLSLFLSVSLCVSLSLSLSHCFSQCLSVFFLSLSLSCTLSSLTHCFSQCLSVFSLSLSPLMCSLSLSFSSPLSLSLIHSLSITLCHCLSVCPSLCLCVCLSLSSLSASLSHLFQAVPPTCTRTTSGTFNDTSRLSLSPAGSSCLTLYSNLPILLHQLLRLRSSTLGARSLAVKTSSFLFCINQRSPGPPQSARPWNKMSRVTLGVLRMRSLACSPLFLYSSLRRGHLRINPLLINRIRCRGSTNVALCGRPPDSTDAPTFPDFSRLLPTPSDASKHPSNA